jgi:hypothetical protein
VISVPLDVTSFTTVRSGTSMTVPGATESFAASTRFAGVAPGAVIRTPSTVWTDWPSTWIARTVTACPPWAAASAGTQHAASAKAASFRRSEAIRRALLNSITLS